MIDPQRILAAHRRVCDDLLDERSGNGHWIGQLSTSALSTATAVSALAIVERHAAVTASGRSADLHRETELTRLIAGGLRWLGDHQNDDGGWGDTDKSYSNIATTMLVVAAFELGGVPAGQKGLLEKAQKYIDAQDGAAGLRRRFGKDKTFAVPILANCALAGLVDWREVSPLPFELACVPQSLFRLMSLPVVSYAIPALVAIGQVCFFHRKPRNPITRAIRTLAVAKSLRLLWRMQPESGGYLEAVPLTSFVVMSLASTGREAHEVTKLGVKFLIESVRPDGSWPIDTNLATWTTTLAINALPPDDTTGRPVLDWLLGCQHRDRHPFTAAAPGGWAWTDLSGGVSDVDDTSGALLALASMRQTASEADRPRIGSAAHDGLRWLLDIQNRDGGWPTFCRGWGTLPFDRSGSDLTAHALRALHAWCQDDNKLEPRIAAATGRGLDYLAANQRTDGSWIPLWFGNQDHPREENPLYGTARVLLAYRDLQKVDCEPARRGFACLRSAQNADGGWGGTGFGGKIGQTGSLSSVEETAVCLEAMLAADTDDMAQLVLRKGLTWIVEAVEAGRHGDSSPIGFYFAKLWYYERLYPLTFTASALSQAIRFLPPRREQNPTAARLKHS